MKNFIMHARMENSNEPASPCIKICKLNRHKLCAGCFRTLKEIAEWPNYTEQQRQEILGEIEKRERSEKTY